MRAVWAKGLPSLWDITQGSALLLSSSWRELLLEDTLSTPSSICNRREAAESIKHLPSLKAINQNVNSSSLNSACIQHTTDETKELSFPNRNNMHASDRCWKAWGELGTLKKQTAKGRKHLPVEDGNFLLRMCSRTRLAGDSAPGCPCAVPPWGRAALMDWRLPSSSVLPNGKVQREMGPGRGGSGSHTKKTERINQLNFFPSDEQETAYTAFTHLLQGTLVYFC